MHAVPPPPIMPITVKSVEEVSRDFFSSTNKLVNDVPISLCFSTPVVTSFPSASIPFKSKCQDKGQYPYLSISEAEIICLLMGLSPGLSRNYLERCE